MLLAAYLFLFLLYVNAPVYAAVLFGGVAWGGFSFVYQEKIRFYLTAKYVSDRTAGWILTMVLMTAGYAVLFCCIGRKCCVLVPLAGIGYLGYKIIRKEYAVMDWAGLILSGALFYILLVY